MGKYLRIKSTGKIGEWQSNPTQGTLISNAGLTPEEAEEIEGTLEDWEIVRSIDPDVIAEKNKAENDNLLANQKVILSVIFDMFNMIRTLEGKSKVTKSQFLDNLKARR